MAFFGPESNRVVTSPVVMAPVVRASMAPSLLVLATGWGWKWLGHPFSVVGR